MNKKNEMLKMTVREKREKVIKRKKKNRKEMISKIVRQKRSRMKTKFKYNTLKPKLVNS